MNSGYLSNTRTTVLLGFTVMIGEVCFWSWISISFTSAGLRILIQSGLTIQVVAGQKIDQDSRTLPTQLSDSLRETIVTPLHLSDGRHR